MNFYRPKRSCEGYVFTPVCPDPPSPGAGSPPSPPPPLQQMATVADGTHPTGMHSRSIVTLNLFCKVLNCAGPFTSSKSGSEREFIL